MRSRRSPSASQHAGRSYLAGALVGAWFTKQALWPVPLPKLRAIPSFFAGWLTNELAFHHLVWQAIVTRFWVRRGALRTWQGKAALGLTVAQWAGLANSIRQTLAAREVLERALEESLGGDEELDAGEEGAAERFRWAQLAAPFPIRHPDVVQTRNVEFARAGAHTLHLDVFRHRDLPQRQPVILFVHGGAWVIGYREYQGLPLLHEMASRGWVGVSAGYRLSPYATFPDHVVDVKRAIAWVREHADEIGADPSFIAIAGGSAGGHLAAVAALTEGEPRCAPGFEEADTSVQACVPFYGIYDFVDEPGHLSERFALLASSLVMKALPADDPERYRLASPVALVRPDAPPFFVVHGEKDTLAPVAGARHFVARLREVSRSPVAYAELPGTQHAFEVFPSLRTAYTIQAVAHFLQHTHNRSRKVSAERAEATRATP